ncbi:hypothetical protein GpartN1_g2976.t1 [Galdieria partita]|uniref:Transmembrane protein n=1 Tax=Galdieria partita TaxID=83374 RepID=A0A9C7UQ44_9RHOD|nr:hypothetical protein GpartN1_g2976.t1 [Galdieria partita]
MASVGALDSQKDNMEVFSLTPVPEEEGESAFEAPPGMQRWLEEKILQSSSSSLVSTVTDTTEEDQDEGQVQPREGIQETVTESLPQEEREKLGELLSKTADASAIKERGFSTQIRPPPTPPQDISMYTNTRRTARSKSDREKGSSKADYLVEALLQSHFKNGKRSEVEAIQKRESSSQVDEAQGEGKDCSSGDNYQIPVHVRDEDSSSDASNEQANIVFPSKKIEKTDSPKLRHVLSRNSWALLKYWLSLFFSMDVAQHYFHEYFRRLPQVIGYTFASVGLAYCLFGFMLLLFAIGSLIGWFIFCAVILSAVVSCILLLGLVAFVVCFICVCTFTVSLYTVLFAAHSLYHVARKSKL